VEPVCRLGIIQYAAAAAEQAGEIQSSARKEDVLVRLE
jgi:hypothetical protein